MKALYQSLLLTIGALVVAGTALAQVPTGNDTSDANGNTGMGLSALGGPAAANSGLYNTAAGWVALSANSGNYNSAFGEAALYSNTSGTDNTAVGANALYFNSTNSGNTAVGFNTLHNNNSSTPGEGESNTAIGGSALAANTTGSNNTAVGVQALVNNTTGQSNTANGVDALWHTTTGNYNTASGQSALFSNIGGTGNEGSYNTANGDQALYLNSTGAGNTASGVNALYANNGNYNTANGLAALYHNSSGGHNIGVGYQAGLNLTIGSNNIDIGSPGVAGESGVIRIGTITGTTSTQSATYIAGIYGAAVGSGSYVCVSSNGQLGTNATSCATPSSRRYKQDIQPMAEASERLLKLRPVTFRYKNPDAHGSKPIQYGLIAEEVAEVFPELVVFNKDGQPDAVMYQVLTPMLLNEVQKQHQQLTALKQQLTSYDSRIAAQDAQLAELKALVATLTPRAKEERVAMR